MDIHHPQLTSYQGVLINIAGQGVFIIGSAGIGKSSFALELIAQGHQLIADDVVEFSCNDTVITGHCPPMLQGLLHTRELGLISIPNIFGDHASKIDHQLNVIVELTDQPQSNITLTTNNKSSLILDRALPLLVLNTANPASLSHRLLCWLAMQNKQALAEDDLTQRQRTLMAK